MNGQPFNRRNFCALVGSTAASLALGSGCRRIAAELKAHGYDVTFREFDGDHEIPADIAREGLLSISM